jgi:hypothetical protein
MSVTTIFEPHRRSHAFSDFKNLDLSKRNCFELLIKMIPASPIARVPNPGGADVALLGIDAILSVV